MIYKILGNTGKGKAACGCLIRANEEYYIETKGNDLLSKCKNHVNKDGVYQTLRVPEDLTDGRLNIR